MKIRPLKDYIVVVPVVAEKKKDGIILPEHIEEIKNKPTRGKVVEIGSDIKQVKKGDLVLFEKYASSPLKIEDRWGRPQEYYFFTEDQILAILE